ncbi:efflux RND transporter permease subunit [Shigella flexneri]
MNSQVILIIARYCDGLYCAGHLYESYVHPLTILFTLPSAGVGRCWRWSQSMPHSAASALIGIMRSIGIVKKNAITMVDFALEAQGVRCPPRNRPFSGCSLRFRPIDDDHAGSAFRVVTGRLSPATASVPRQPLGITIVGGLVMSQLLTLDTTPAGSFCSSIVVLRFSRQPATIGN